MNKTYIWIIVLVLVALGGWYFIASKKTEAPAGSDTTTVPVNMHTEATINPDSTLKINTTAQVPAVKSVVKTFTVTGQNYSFTPSTITVKKGDTVKITFKNLNGNHNFIIDEFNVNSGIIAGGEQKTINFVADKTGSFQYYCSVGSHRAMGMWGTLKVE
jgi:nitrite reductase (NO-forming)